MAFHIQLQRGHRRVHLFNQSQDELRRQLFEPWSRGAAARVAERDWEPAETRLIVLEGRALEPAELGMGRGWRNAGKAARDVTAELLARELPRRADTVGLIATSAEAGQAVATLLAAAGARAVTAAEAPAGAPLIVALDDELTTQVAFEIGVAVGMARERALVVQLGRSEPPALSGIQVLRLEPGAPESAATLAERLRALTP